MKLKNEALNVRYSVIQAIYWPIVGSSYAFCSAYLLNHNFLNKEIGIIFALANVLAVLLQPLIASFLDRTEKISVKMMLILLTMFGFSLTLLRALSSADVVLAVTYTIEIGLLFSMQPLLNSLAMQLINEGRDLNFGSGRAMGSLGYAVYMLILGALTEKYGLNIVPGITLVLYGCQMAALLTFVKVKKNAAYKTAAVSQSLAQFVHTHKRFFIFVVGVALIFVGNCYVNNYLMQIIQSVGGTTKDLGFANSFAAILELPAMIGFLWLRKYKGCSFLLKFSFIAFTVKVAVLLFARNVTMVFVSQTFQFCGYAIFIPGSIYYVNQILEKENLVKGQAFVTSAITAGGIIASLTGGVLLDSFGVPAMLLTGVIASLLGVGCAFISIEKTA